MNKGWCFATILVASIALGIGVGIGYFVSNKEPSSLKHARLTRQANEQDYQAFIDSISAANIEANLKDLTSRPHLAGLPEGLDSALVVEQRWINDSLLVNKTRYNVLLSYPDNNKPNRVTMRTGNGTLIIETNGTEKVYDPTQPKTVIPFLAYTTDGTVNSAKLYYANYGRLQDLELLASVVGNASLQGSVIIMRYGEIFRGDKIIHAQNYGAVGAILYNDPANYAPFGTTPDEVYNQTWFMPPSGTQRGSAYTAEGDPLTPVYPSTDYMYRVQEGSVEFLPKIPAQPIGYGEAQVILQYLTGAEVNPRWRGALKNVTYRYGGPLRESSTIDVTSYNRRERKDIYNVIGIMKGEIEPDRYIVLGNHRDAWSLGALDPTSGTATLLEVTRALGQMYRDGFRPRRSLMFCSWDAEEYGLIGSVEYVQQYVKVLGARIVSYLNVDIAVGGNYTLYTHASPMMFDVMVEAAKMVPSAYDPPGTTVYDKWMKVYRNNDTNEPMILYGLGSGSDFFGFNQLVGSSNVDVTYVSNPADNGNVTSYPLYHTSYEAFSTMKKFVDPDFTAHRTIGQYWGVLALSLSETPLLHLNVTRYTLALQQAVDGLNPRDRTVLNPLRSAINDFGTAAEEFVARSKSIDPQNPYEIRAYNDQLLYLERAFLNPLGQGGDYSDFKHIIYAPAKGNQYAAAGFPTISDAIAGGDDTEINNQIVIATFFVRGALSTLKEFNNFFG